MDKNELDGLLALKLVAEKQNFTAAADELGISPPAISKMVKQLEKRLGAPLLSRTTRSTSLTEAGKKFLNEAGPAMDQILAAIKNVSENSEQPSGMLRINLPKVIYQPYLKPLLKTFRKKYPDVSVELFFEDHTSDVVKGGFDAGVRLSEIVAKDMVAIKLFGPVRFVVAGSRKYFEKYGTPKRPQDLLTHDCIRFRFLNGVLYDHWEFEQKGKDFQVQVKGSLIYNDPMMLHEAAIDGMGLTYMAEDEIKASIASGRLETVLDAYAATSPGYYLYFPKRSQVAPKLRAFIDHIKNEGTSDRR